MVRVSLKDLWKSSSINGLQAASKAFILTICEDSSKRIKLAGSALSATMFDHTFAKRNLYKPFYSTSQTICEIYNCKHFYLKFVRFHKFHIHLRSVKN